ncbi:aspartate kinase [Rossellomorea marisflavi]|uniref:aspartate kinase n=1 Tax=Rossellomorea marisflavi TaxID=189381 RepID=UPI001EE35B7F|nr:aspartate kinase [Rossellomorea marisflavi]MDW4527962.1 aspartate kinase [Rossellomorea marisflavi]UKS64583.1 aspartate kinase [Rossellomorea marisflavi]
MVEIIVQKFGGTSVGSVERIKRMAQHVIREKQKGKEVAVVVSAMGDTTDHLTKLAGEITAHPPKREMDLLLSTGEQITIALLTLSIQEAGFKAVSLTGRQAGIRTDGVHGKARIKEIDPSRVQDELRKGIIPVVAGFQGITDAGEITTLGRGGSDTTATALAAALGAERCDIYTDVDGIYTTDPRVVPAATRIPHLTYREVLCLADSGAAVIHPRAVFHSKKSRIPFRILPGLIKGEGTLVDDHIHTTDRGPVGVAFKDEVTSISMKDSAYGLESLLKESLEVIHVKPDLHWKGQDLTLTVDASDRSDVEHLLRDLGQEYSKKVEQAKVTIVKSPGSDILRFGVRSTLGDSGIDVSSIHEDPEKVTALIGSEDIYRAADVLHTFAGLDASGAKRVVR